MASAILIPPAFAGLDPVESVRSFWIIGVTGGSWITTGSTDIGVDLQAIDGNLISGANDGTGVSSGGQIIFEDAGAIPPTAQIDSVQLVVDLDAVGMRMIEAFYYSGAFAAIPLVGADTDDFTGSGTFSSAVMTLNPGTGLAWEYGDLYGNNYTAPSGFQGWYGIQGSGGTTSPAGTQAYTLNYMALLVEFSEGGPVVPTNWTMGAVFIDGNGKGSREFGMRRIT